jgi:hypothetical protein
MSCAVYFMPHFAYLDDRMSIHGTDLGLWVFGWYVFCGLVIAVNMRLAQEIKTWNWPVHLSIWLSMAALYIWGGIYSPIWPVIGKK